MDMQEDIEKLIEFATNQLRAGGVVQQKVLHFANTLSTELQVNQTPDSGADMILLISLSNFPTFGVQQLKLPLDTTLAHLKTKVDYNFLSTKGMEVSRVKLLRTEQTWSTFDEKTLSSLGIKSGDSIVCGCSSASTVKEADHGLLRLCASGVRPNSPSELLALCMHSFFLDAGFVYTYALPNATPGFAPSIRGEYHFMDL